MKLQNLLALAVISTSLIACGNSDAVSPSAYPQAFSNTSSATPTTATPFVEDTSKSKSPADVLNPVSNQTAATPNSGVKLNPPHGQPGHRCDIPDGAPLNTPPTTAANTQKTNQVQSAVQTLPTANVNQVITPTPQKSTASTAKGLNPEHGQPGHRCEIAVGAPLDSKPTTVSQTQPTVTAPTQTKTVTAPGMNPPHGEPGHKCEIAVGAPLNGEKKDGN